MSDLYQTAPNDPHVVAWLGTLGTAGAAILTWLGDRMQTLDQTLAIITHFFGCGVAVLTFCLLLHRYRHRNDRNPPREPPDVDDDLP